jgi:hypothetical protein
VEALAALVLFGDGPIIVVTGSLDAVGLMADLLMDDQPAEELEPKHLHEDEFALDDDPFAVDLVKESAFMLTVPPHLDVDPFTKDLINEAKKPKHPFESRHARHHLKPQGYTTKGKSQICRHRRR